jgi:glycosyltransferase involved in cell wall biosynthesis
MNYPKISVVTPSFNQASYLEETILSVITQNYPNLEYIIIDGGSSDGSVEIIKKYEMYLTYWVSEPDNGHGHALNKGFAKSTGEIMAWINSDDKYYPYTFTTVAEIFSKFNDINWIQGKNSWIDKSGRLTDVQFSFINIYSYLLFDYKWIQQESVFWRRSLWDKAGSFINRKMELMVDGELWTRFFLSDDIWHLDLVISSFRSHEKNRSHTQIEKVYSEMDEVINRMKPKLSPKQKSSFDTLQKYLELIQVSDKKQKSIYRNKILKLIPHFLYSRFIRYLISRETMLLDFKGETYEYKLLNCIYGNWEKNTRKFRYIEELLYH